MEKFEKLIYSDVGVNLSDEQLEKMCSNMDKDKLLKLLKLYNNKLLELQETNEMWKFMACCDVLTTGKLNNDTDRFDECSVKIYTRSYWENIFRPANKQLEADCYLIDLNDLKFVNDTIGHSAGDKLIL